MAVLDRFRGIKKRSSMPRWAAHALAAPDPIAVARVAGLTNTRHLRGRLTRDLGISKAGNVHVRSRAIELA